jgi:hypothetical protein
MLQECIEKIVKLFEYDTYSLLDCIFYDDSGEANVSAESVYNRFEIIFMLKKTNCTVSANSLYEWLELDCYNDDDAKAMRKLLEECEKQKKSQSKSVQRDDKNDLWQCIEKIVALYKEDTLSLLDCVFSNDPNDPHFSANMVYNRLENVILFERLHFSAVDTSVYDWLKANGYSHEAIELFKRKRLEEDERKRKEGRL